MSTGTLRRSFKRLLSLTSSESSTLVPDNGNKILVVGLGNYPAPRSRHSVGKQNHQLTPINMLIGMLISMIIDMLIDVKLTR